ncbi:MAG: aspartate--ammonia ligase [Prolixibacteraceae bacterium]|jgi:aspartate--ammonia ligase|nr:aspartate--ammonia ligase [Prolixibacteraceae bacterium]
MKLFIPKNYQPVLDLKQTEKAIKLIKDSFQEDLSAELRLRRVTAPLFVMQGTGINDDLNGIERPVSFPVKELGDRKAEVVQSLAKWKRMSLADLEIEEGYGLYTDMNAIRPDEELDNIHSLYVDQWDWERVISTEERNLDFLKKIVRKIYTVLLRTEFSVFEHYPQIKPILPEEITLIHAEELEARYPQMSPKERENTAAKEYGAVFIIGIGAVLPGGEKHDGRAPDYDDWTSETINNYKGLNGDIVIWNPILESAFEISSMGIRVDKDALVRQLAITGTEERRNLYWHQRLLNGELPLSIGGGIGQSRLCMYFLRKAHIGEIQSSIWPEEMIRECAAHHIHII